MTTSFLDLAKQATQHTIKLVSEPDYRAFARLRRKLRRMPRYVPCEIDVLGLHLYVPDAASFLSGFEEIFINRIYAFSYESESPKILDVGANIGLSVLYFKSLFPRAEITALEADPVIFNCLEKNVRGNGFDDVCLLNCAAWNRETTLTFISEGADGGYVSTQANGDAVKVDAVDLSRLLHEESFDFLKIDIEGSEETVLPACEGCFESLRFIFVEYHSRPGQEQLLDRILGVLKKAGFRFQIQSLGPWHHFGEPKPQTGFDLQLNIFGWRESC